MTDGSEKRSRQLAFELQNSHVCEKHSKQSTKLIRQLGILDCLLGKYDIFNMAQLN